MEEASMLASDHADPWEDGPAPAPAALLAGATRAAGSLGLGTRAGQAQEPARAAATGSLLWPPPWPIRSPGDDDRAAIPRLRAA